MNICVVCRDNVFYYNRPTHSIVREMMKALLEAGHKVSLVVFDLPHRSTMSPIEGINTYFHAIKLEIVLLSLFSRFLFRASTYDLLCVRLGLVRNLRKKMLRIMASEKIDIVVCENFLCSIPVTKAISEVPVVVTARDVVTENFLEKSQVYGARTSFVKLALPYYEAMQLMGLQTSDACVVQTQHDADRFRDLGTPAEKLFVVPSGGYTADVAGAVPASRDVELAKRLGIREGDPVLFFCGANAFNNNKAAENIAKFILPRLLESLPNAKMIFAGRVCEYIEHANLCAIAPNNIILVGYVEDISSYYSLYDIQLLPMTHATGMQLKLADAMAVGKPVICTSKAAAGYEVLSGRDVIIEDMIGNYHLHVLDLLKNPQRAKAIGENARRMSLRYDWKEVAQGYVGVISEVWARDRLGKRKQRALAS